MTGSCIGHYQIEDKIGEGGMGVVYKATDTRLLRPVAIKFLPPHVVTGEKNRLRFMHEARAASALNHPNICTVYDIGQIESTYFIVMEYINGQTLREILHHRGPLPEKEASEICMQVCSALSAAHAKGIVHRDIKPDNIIRTQDGHVKVMDFGLAKLMTEKVQPSSPNKTMIDTTLNLEQFKTSVSSFEGTASYMAPEQIEKGAVDARTDIYSLGIVLFELLTGVPPFKGQDSLSLMTKILDESPPAPSSLQSGISAPMETLILAALSKSPQARPQSGTEMRKALQAIASPQRRSRAIKAAFSFAAMLMTLLMFLFARGRFDSQAKPGLQPLKLAIQGLDLTMNSNAWPSLSPDGNQLAYISTSPENVGSGLSLKIKYLDSGVTRTLYQPSQALDRPVAHAPSWSPNGRWLAVHQESGGIGLVEHSGEHGFIALTDFGYVPKWSPDGRKLAFSSQNPFQIWQNNQIWIYDLRDSTAKQVSPVDNLSYDSPSWSPDGRSLLCLGGVGSQRSLWILAVASHQVQPLPHLELEDLASPLWSPPGNYIYFRARVERASGLFRVRVEPLSGRPLSEFELVLPDDEFGLYSLSRDGKTMVYQTGQEREKLWRLPNFASGTVVDWQPAELLTTHTTFTANLEIAPDGGALVFENGNGRVRSLELFDIKRKTQKVLYDQQNAYSPSWSPDGRWIAFDAGGGNDADIWRIPTAGGQAEKVIAYPGADWMPTYAPDGQTLCFLSNRSGQFDLWIYSTTSDAAHAITRTPEIESGGYWAHGGVRIAYFRNPLAGTGTGVWIYDLRVHRERLVYFFPDRKMDILTKIAWRSDDAALYFYDKIGLAQLDLMTKTLSYPFGEKRHREQYIRYALHEDALYLIERTPMSRSIWMAEGLE